MKCIQTCILLGIIIVMIASIFIINDSQRKRLSKTTDSDLPLSTLLNNSNIIKIEKKFYSLNKHYYILADNMVVGEVKGKRFPVLGDTLIMTDVKGNVIKSEYEIKRVGFSKKNGFNISLNRLAELVDADSNTTGYIGEERLKNLLSVKHIQYFYDANKTTQGYAKRNSIILYNKDYTVYNNDNTTAYTIDGTIFNLPSKATITKHTDSHINMEDVIFYTIIENSIVDYSFTNSNNSAKH